MSEAKDIDSDVVFFDGHCGLCHFWVKFTLSKDKKKRFCFSPQQGETIKDVLSPEQISSLPDSIIVVTKEKEILTKSTAISYILKNLGSIWTIFGWLIWIIPYPIRNFVYDLIAKVRKTILKKPDDICPVTSFDLRERILL